MSETKIKDLRINKGLTKQQLIESTTITESELSFVTDDSVVDVPAPTEAGKVLTSTEDGVEWAEGGSGGLPDQTGNAGKFLTTDGTDASWNGGVIVNNRAMTEPIHIGNNEGSYRSAVIIGRNSRGYLEGAYVGNNLQSGADASYYGVVFGDNWKWSSDYMTLIGFAPTQTCSGGGAIAIGYKACVTSNYAIQLGRGTNNEANTFSVGLSNTNNYKLLNADGTIPADRLAKNETLTADTITLVPEHIYTGGELATVSVTLPTALSTNEAIQLNFGSGATATNITINKDASQTLVMKGAGCSGGVFSPAANKNYSIMFYNNGFAIIGLVIEQ